MGHGWVGAGRRGAAGGRVGGEALIRANRQVGVSVREAVAGRGSEAMGRTGRTSGGQVIGVVLC